jgi:signal peptidase II
MISLFASGSLIFVVDQWSKKAVQLRLSGRSVSFGPLLRFRLVASSKETYRREVSRAELALLWLAAFVSAIVLHLSGAWFQSDLALIGLGLAIGGAAGNLVDILRRRCVVDFIDLGWWPVFNLADIAIIAGLAMALASQRISS